MSSDQKEVIIFTLKGCVLCPSAKEMVRSVCESMACTVNEIDLMSISEDLEMRLLEHGIYIASVPSIVLCTGDDLKLVSRGEVPAFDVLYGAIVDGGRSQ